VLLNKLIAVSPKGHSSGPLSFKEMLKQLLARINVGSNPDITRLSRCTCPTRESFSSAQGKLIKAIKNLHKETHFTTEYPVPGTNMTLKYDEPSCLIQQAEEMLMKSSVTDVDNLRLNLLPSDSRNLIKHIAETMLGAFDELSKNLDQTQKDFEEKTKNSCWVKKWVKSIKFKPNKVKEVVKAKAIETVDTAIKHLLVVELNKVRRALKDLPPVSEKNSPEEWTEMSEWRLETRETALLESIESVLLETLKAKNFHKKRKWLTNMREELKKFATNTGQGNYVYHHSVQTPLGELLALLRNANAIYRKHKPYFKEEKAPDTSQGPDFTDVSNPEPTQREGVLSDIVGRFEGLFAQVDPSPPFSSDRAWPFSATENPFSLLRRAAQEGPSASSRSSSHAGPSSMTSSAQILPKGSKEDSDTSDVSSDEESRPSTRGDTGRQVPRKGRFRLILPKRRVIRAGEEQPPGGSSAAKARGRKPKRGSQGRQRKPATLPRRRDSSVEDLPQA